MAQPKVYEGTWDELAAHSEELRTYPKLTLIVPPVKETQEQTSPGQTQEIERFRKQGLREVGLFAHVPGGSYEPEP